MRSKKILNALKGMSLILIDGASIKGKTTFSKRMDRLTDVYILENLEKIIREKSQKGSVYCCSRSFKEVKAMKDSRNKEFVYSVEADKQIMNQYNYSKKLPLCLVKFLMVVITLILRVALWKD